MYKVSLISERGLCAYDMEFRSVLLLIKRTVPESFERFFPYILLNGISYLFYDYIDKVEKYVVIIKKRSI